MSYEGYRAHRRLLTLLDVGTVVSGGGGGTPILPILDGLGVWYKADQGTLGLNAAQFATANSEYLSIANNPALMFGNIAWTVGGWVYLDAGGIMVIIAQSQTQAVMDWQVYYHTTVGQLIANTYAGGSYPQAIIGGVTAGAWHFIVMSFDPAVGTGALSLQVDNGAINTNSAAGPMTNFPTGGVTLGCNGYDAPAYSLSGRMQHWFLFARALDTAERNFLWNGGNGRGYEDLPSTFRTNLRAWWPLDELSGPRRDLAGGNTLTDNNTVTSNTGKVYSQAGGDGAIIHKWLDSSLHHYDLGGASVTATPTLQINELNGKPVARFDGVDDYMEAFTNPLGSDLCGPQAQTVFVVQRQTSTDGASTTYNWDPTGAGTNILSTHLAYADNVLYYDTGDAVADTGRLRANRPLGWVDTWHIVEMVRDGGTTNSAYIIDGNPITAYLKQPTGTFNGAVTGVFRLGEHASLGPHIFQGDIAELIMFNRTLSTTERTQVRDYLKSRWGIAQNKLLTTSGAYGYVLIKASDPHGRLAIN